MQFRRQGLNTASAQKDSKQTGEQEEVPVAAASNYHTTRASPHHHIGAPRPTPPPTHVHRRQTEFHPCQIVPTRKDRCAHDNNPQWWARLKTVVATKSASPTPKSSAATATLALEESILFPGSNPAVLPFFAAVQMAFLFARKSLAKESWFWPRAHPRCLTIVTGVSMQYVVRMLTLRTSPDRSLS